MTDLQDAFNEIEECLSLPINQPLFEYLLHEEEWSVDEDGKKKNKLKIDTEIASILEIEEK